MRASIISLTAAFLWIAAHSSMAADISPTFDTSGIWSNGRDPGGYDYFQNGLDVKILNVNRGFASFYSGTYVSNTAIEGVWQRKNRSNGCITRMKMDIVVKSADEQTWKWTVLDSNCDLQKGKSGEDAVKRLKSVEYNLWY